MCALEKPQYPQTDQKLTRFLPWLVLAIIIAVTAGLRFHLLDVPLERDEGEYAYAGQLMLQGIPPYLLAYNMKMPGIYTAYALLLAAFGQTCAGIHLGLLVVNAATTLLIFLLAKYLTDSWAGVFAAAAFAVMSLAASVHGIFANAEHFVLLFAIPGLLLLLYAVDRDNLLLLLTASLLLGLSLLMKQHAAAFVVFAALYLLFSQLRRKPLLLKPLLIKPAVFAAGAALPFAVTCLILWHAGVFEKFWFWTFVYARQYVSIVPLRDGLQVLKVQAVNVASCAVLILILAAIGLLASSLNKKIRHRSAFIIGFSVFSFLSICPGFYFRPHYFVLLLPAVALLSAIGQFDIRQVLKPPMPAITKDLIVISLTVAAPLYTLYHQRDYLFESDPAVVSRMTYPYEHFPEYLKIAEYLKDNTSKDDTIAVLGSEPQIFFYAHRRSASGYIYVFPLMEPHPYALQMQQEMIQQIETARPNFLLFTTVPMSWSREPTSNKMIFEWFEQYRQKYYRLVALADFASADHVDYYWNQDTTNYQLRSLIGVAIFQRNQ